MTDQNDRAGCEPIDPENEKILRDLFADEDVDHLTRRLFALVDRLRSQLTAAQRDAEAKGRALEEAIQFAAEGWSYAPNDYTREQHEYGTRMAKLASACGASSASAPAKSPEAGTSTSCPECHGDGADQEDSSRDCWKCDGRGEVRACAARAKGGR